MLCKGIMSTVPAPCCTSRWHRQCSKKSSHSIVHFGVHPLKSKNESVAQWVKLGKNVGSQRWPLNIKLGRHDILFGYHSLTSFTPVTTTVSPFHRRSSWTRRLTHWWRNSRNGRLGHHCRSSSTGNNRSSGRVCWRKTKVLQAHMISLLVSINAN